MPCKLANASYQRRYRHAAILGRKMLRTAIPSTEARRLLRRLLLEGYRQAQIARALGLRERIVRVHHRITYQRLVRLRRLAKTWLDT